MKIQPSYNLLDDYDHLWHCFGLISQKAMCVVMLMEDDELGSSHSQILGMERYSLIPN